MSSPRSAEFIPSSIRAMSLKVSKSFAQHVNLKIEPTLFSDWCKKPDNKKKSESSQIRFCVITPAAFYLCKLRHISTIKISQVFPWISITSFKCDINKHDVTLDFGDTSIYLLFDNVKHFVSKAVSYLKSILPSYFPVQYSIPPEIESSLEIVKPIPSQIAYLFLSKCKVLKENVDTNFILNLKHDMKNKKSFVIDSSQLSDVKVDAMCSAILNFPYIKKVKFGGKNFNRLYHKVSVIISKNSEIRKLEIFKYRNDHKFIDFVNKLKTSHITSLTFTEVDFTQEMSEILTKELPSINLKKINFSGCQFSKIILPELQKNFNDSTTDLIIHNDTFSPTQIRNLVMICLSSNITNLVLTDSSIDIKGFFDVLAPNINTFKVEKLDLSGNVCSSIYGSTFPIPKNLKTLILQRITWEGDSLISFLSKQVFDSEIELDLTRSYLTNDQVVNLMKYLPENSSANIVKFNWSNNPIFLKLFNYISKLENLRELTLDNCIYPSVDRKPDKYNERKAILLAFVDLISNLNVKKLSIKGTMKDYGKNLMVAAKNALIENQTITSLHIDDNSITDEGLSILKTVLLENKVIKCISFDCCDLKNYQSLISFINSISTIPNLKHISKPQAEISRLSELNGKKAAREIKAAWSSIDANRNQEKKFCDESSSCRSSNSLASSTMMFVSTNDMNEIYVPMTHLEAEWESGFDMPYDGSVNEWSSLKQLYSYENITGIEALNHLKENQNSEFL